MGRRRLDAELVRRGMAPSRQRAQGMIAEGRVTVRGMPAGKPATQVDSDTPIAVSEGTEPEWASRGAHKLVGALARFEAHGLAEPAGRACLDAGASTGGFTDVLLSRGAARVIAVDVGYGQLIWRLQQDPRVTVLDRTNIRQLTAEDLPEAPDLIVADLSFISLEAVLPALAGLADPAGDMLLMVKPQFEVGRERLGAGGVVRDPQLRAEAVRSVCNSASGLGWGTAGVTASPLPGPAGNVEYFVWLRRDAGPVSDDEVDRAVAEGPK